VYACARALDNGFVCVYGGKWWDAPTQPPMRTKAPRKPIQSMPPTHTRAHVRARTHTLRGQNPQAHTHARSHARTHANTHTHTNTPPRTHEHTHARARTHTHLHAPTRTHMRAHTYAARVRTTRRSTASAVTRASSPSTTSAGAARVLSFAFGCLGLCAPRLPLGLCFFCLCV
jgi:hypothetical protein